ncbi:MAG: two-component regulator propeller domain-containing protein [Ferruginibacter sp.]|nr:two-component regulator propeller domain-containing protein [Ferruginibacter sp.]
MEHYSTEDGLSHNNVTSIIKSSDGFMWFGTWDGINRFDGHNFVTYKSHPGDSSGLNTNRIDRIVEDQAGFLWLRPYDNQVLRFDKKTGRLLSISAILARANISNIKFDKIIPSNGGIVWLTTLEQGLFCVRNAASTAPEVTRYGTGSPPGQTLASNSIKFLYEDQLRNVWVGTERGLSCLTATAGNIYKTKTTQLEGLPAASFTCVTEDAGKLWFGTGGGNLVTYEKSNGRFSFKSISRHRVNALLLSRKSNTLFASSAGGEIIAINTDNLVASTSALTGKGFLSALYEDRSGRLWVEPEKGGIVKYEPATKKITYFFHENDATLNYPVRLFGVFEDNENRVWVSMASGGFGYYDPTKDAVEYFYNQPGSPNRKFSNIVGVRYFDPEGVLWFTSSDRGIEKIIFQRKDLDPALLVNQTSNKTDNDVRGIFNDRKNRIWLASKSGTVYLQTPDGKQLTDLFVNGPAGGIGSVYTLLQDRRGDMWLGTKGNGLFKAIAVDSNALKYRLTQYRAARNNPYSLSSDAIYSLLEDNNGRIWVGTFENGLNMILEQGDQLMFINANNDLKNYPTAAAGKIRHLGKDAKGQLWVATTNGLLVADITTPTYRDFQFKSYRKTPGDKTSLSNNDLQFIFKDSKNRMWISTSGGGLNLATPAANNSFQFKVFTREDGLPSDYILSIAEDKSGNLWLGTENGLCKFNPDRNLFRNYDSYDGLMKAGFSEASGLRLNNDNLLFGTVNGYVIFDPAAVSNRKLKANMAFTNLQVNNKDVVAGEDGATLLVDINSASQVELRHDQNIISIDFTMLDFISNDKQTYTYRLKGFDKDWNNVVNQHRATYTNLPPGDYTFEVKNLSEDLYEKVPAKTLSITIFPPWWRTWWAYLLYAILIVALAEIIRRTVATMLRLRNKVVVEKQLTDLKIKFFTNISHELRTPLTLIIHPIEEVIKQHDLSRKSFEYLTVARKNTNRMVRFINQLLDFQKVQSGKMSLKIGQTEMVSFVKDIAGYFSDAAEEKQIELSVTSNVAELTAWVDKGKLDIVFYNLLSNAFKFTPKGKKITIDLQHQGNSAEFKVSVTDEGIGVPPDKLQEIFELYYEVDKPASDYLAGTGIGLALSKDIIQFHHGKISAQNNPSGGLTVSVELNIHKDHFKPGEVVIAGGIPENKTELSLKQSVAMEQVVLQDKNRAAGQPDLQTVLVVEDNGELRRFLADQLAPHYKVVEAENGREGLEKATEVIPDLILSDVRMPEMNGIMMLDKLKNNPRTSHIPVILLTAKSSVESQLEGLNYGADYYITKPFHAEVVLALISNLLKQRRKMFDVLLSGNPHSLVDQEEKEFTEALVITAKDEAFLKEVIGIVEKSMEDPQFNIDKVAESLLMGRTTFYKKLKSLTNMSPVEFIREVRLKTAKELLDSVSNNIATVAYEVGFSNAKYFSTCFREKYNCSPSDYLKAKKVKVNTPNT